MKATKNIVWIALIALFYSVHINAQSFVKTQGAATDIAISPYDGSVYVIGTSKNVFKYNFGTKSFIAFGQQSRNVKSITVHPNSNVYMVSTSNEVYIDVGGRWDKIPGIKTNEVDIDKNGNIRALDLSGKLKKLFQGSWQDQNLVNRNTSGFNQIVGKDSKVLYGRFKDNAFKEFRSGKWVTLNGNPLKINIDNKTGIVYAVGRNKGIYKWNSSSKKWILLDGTRKDFTDVAVHDGKIWAIATDKSIYYYGVSGQSSTSNSTDYAGTYRVTFTDILGQAGFNINNHDFYGTMGVYLESKTKSGNVSIKPLDNQPNRVLDISKNRTAKKTPLNYKIGHQKFHYLTPNSNNAYQHSEYYNAKYIVNRIREFKLQGEAANKDAVFDFQFNLKEIGIAFEHLGEWVRVKIPVKDIIFNKEYLFYSYVGTGNNGICFKIEKL